jgi:hypothetical protein
VGKTLILPSGQAVFHDWYATAEGQWLMNATVNGMLMFVWEAKYDDGRVVRQFDDVNFTRAMTDVDFVPPEDLRLSVDSLEKEHVSQFTLYPIAMARSRAPWFQQPIEVQLDLKHGDRFVSFWLTDYSPKTGYIIRRSVIGIEKDGIKHLIVISPSGRLTICSHDNYSFEGE